MEIWKVFLKFEKWLYVCLSPNSSAVYGHKIVWFSQGSKNKPTDRRTDEWTDATEFIISLLRQRCMAVDGRLILIDSRSTTSTWLSIKTPLTGNDSYSVIQPEGRKQTNPWTDGQTLTSALSSCFAKATWSATINGCLPTFYLNFLSENFLPMRLNKEETTSFLEGGAMTGLVGSLESPWTKIYQTFKTMKYCLSHVDLIHFLKSHILVFGHLILIRFKIK